MNLFANFWIFSYLIPSVSVLFWHQYKRSIYCTSEHICMYVDCLFVHKIYLDNDAPHSFPISMSAHTHKTAFQKVFDVFEIESTHARLNRAIFVNLICNCLDQSHLSLTLFLSASLIFICSHFSFHRLSFEHNKFSTQIKLCRNSFHGL